MGEQCSVCAQNLIGQGVKQSRFSRDRGAFGGASRIGVDGRNIIAAATRRQAERVAATAALGALTNSCTGLAFAQSTSFPSCPLPCFRAHFHNFPYLPNFFSRDVPRFQDPVPATQYQCHGRYFTLCTRRIEKIIIHRRSHEPKSCAFLEKRGSTSPFGKSIRPLRRSNLK